MTSAAAKCQRVQKSSGTATHFFGARKNRSFFQPKLTVNTPGDAHEQEADRVADQVMRMREGDAPIVQRMPITPLGSVQRKCADCEQEEQAQRKETGGGDASGKAAPSIVSDVLSSGGGQPMDGGTQQFMERRFGQDFSQVRVHTDSRAAESAGAIQARAYTSGRDIVFGAGEYQPSSSEGQRLLAHELVHVGQQKKENPFNQLQRYSHDSSCQESDLRDVIWPGDHAAKQITQNAINKLSTCPNHPALSPLYLKYFRTSTPNSSQVQRILGVYNGVQSAFNESNYQYECVNSGCTYNGEVTVLPIWGGIGDIRICVGVLRGKSATCIGRTILHEFTHYFFNTEDHAYCKSGCGFSTCPPSLTTEQALDNADSYACFAYELYSTVVSCVVPASSTETSASEIPDAGGSLPGGVQ
jgi:Domain of unknown function (DUF4157)/Lysine-specific metallo-endopeptidase